MSEGPYDGDRTIDLEQTNPRMSRDLVKAATTLGETEVRFLVDYYYQLQEARKARSNQVRQCFEQEEPHEVLRWLRDRQESDEKQVKRALKAYADSTLLGKWSQSIIGIGPVISAGLIAHVDIEQCPTVGHLWSFAGVNPEQRWEKKQKRPWNARLKVLVWKIGQSFVKTSNHERSFYGPLYKQRKEYEQGRNGRGELADQAAAILAKKKIGKTTEAYKHYSAGRLPPAHIQARSERWTAKLFLAHWHHVAYEIHYGERPPKPYILTQAGGHAHHITPPNWA